MFYIKKSKNLYVQIQFYVFFIVQKKLKFYKYNSKLELIPFLNLKSHSYESRIKI